MTNVRDLRGDLQFVIPIPGQSTANTADEWVALVAPWPLKITGVKWVPNAAVTANGTNYFTLNLRNRKADASGALLPASRSYAATNSAAFVAEAMTLSGTSTDLEIAANEILTVEKLVAGTGLAMPDGTIQIAARIR